MSKKVLVAMSGGVDSSVAALLLKNEGYNVSGITMHFGSLTEGDQKRSCTSAAIDDAKKICDKLKIHHHVFDSIDGVHRSTKCVRLCILRQGLSVFLPDLLLWPV